MEEWESNLKMESKYLIKSKIDNPSTKKILKLLKGLKYIMAGYTVLIALNFITGDFQFKDLRPLILPVAYYFYYKNRVSDKDEMGFTTVEATLNPDEIILHYSKIDQHDGKGKRDEVITYSYQKIYELEYDSELLCLRIAGNPIIKVQYDNQKKYPGSNVIANGEETQIHYIYLDAENEETFINTLGQFSRIKIKDREES